MVSSSTVHDEVVRGRTVWYLFLLAIPWSIWSAQGRALKFLNRQLGPIEITFLPFYIGFLSEKCNVV